MTDDRAGTDTAESGTAGRGTAGNLRVLGTLRSTNGSAVVRLEERLDAGIGEVWSAVTEPGRLSHWLGEVTGELRQDGEFSAHFFASGWEGTCRVELCEAPHRLRIKGTSPGEPDTVMEATLTADGDQTILVLEDRGLPPEQIAAYGAGDQIHLEDLTAYLAGSGPCDARARWQKLHPAYQNLAADLA